MRECIIGQSVTLTRDFLNTYKLTWTYLSPHLYLNSVGTQVRILPGMLELRGEPTCNILYLCPDYDRGHIWRDIEVFDTCAIKGIRVIRL